VVRPLNYISARLFFRNLDNNSTGPQTICVLISNDLERGEIRGIHALGLIHIMYSKDKCILCMEISSA
jgi:hypothetical protein